MTVPVRSVVGILGGTFDPIHNGHLRLAEEMREHFGLARVHFIPAGDPYQKTRIDGQLRRPITAAAQRLAMLRIAVAGNPYFVADEREMHRDGPSYSIDTLRSLRAELGPEPALIWLMGSDTFLGMPTWHRWEELFEFAHIAVAERAGHTSWRNAMAAALFEQFEYRLSTGETDLHQHAAGRIAVVPMTALDISSSAIRAQLAQGRSPRYLVHGGVLDHISQHQLYSQE